MITLHAVRALLSHVTIRTEKHGEDVEPASTLKFEIERDNKVLEEIAEGLRAALYYDDESSLPLESDWLPDLRFPVLGKIPLDIEAEGYTVQVIGQKPRATLTFQECEIKNASLECAEGGTVTITLSVNCHPDAGDVAKLYRLNGHKVELTLEPPEEPQEPLPGTEGEDP